MDHDSQRDHLGELPRPNLGRWSKGRRRHSKSQQRGASFDRVSSCFNSIIVLLYVLLFALSLTPSPVFGITRPYNLTDYDGHLAISSPENIHVATETGHLLFRVDIVKEMSFVRRLFRQILRTSNNKYFNETLALSRKELENSVERLTSLLDSVYRKLPKHKVPYYPSLAHGHHMSGTTTGAPPSASDEGGGNRRRRNSQEFSLRTNLISPPLPSHTNDIIHLLQTAESLTERRPKLINQKLKAAALRRRKRWIPFISLGLGIANSIHLAILDSTISSISSKVDATVYRVNQLTNVVQSNARHVNAIAKEIDSLAKIVQQQNTETVKALTLSMTATNVLTAINIAQNHVDIIFTGVKELIKQKLPPEFFSYHDLKSTFVKFQDKVALQGLEPISHIAAQIYEAESSFVLTTDPLTHRIFLSILTPIPLQRLGVDSFQVYQPEPSMMLVNDSAYEWRPRPAGTRLIVGPHGTTALAPDSYMTRCLAQHGPRGRICPRITTDSQTESCMAAVFTRGSLTRCHDQLHLLSTKATVVRQQGDQTFLVYAPQPDRLSIACSSGLRRFQTVTVHKLQHLSVIDGCTVSVGSFLASTFQEPRLNATIMPDIVAAEEVINLLELPPPVFDHSRSDIDKLIDDNRALVDDTSITLQSVAKLASKPLTRLSHHYAPWLAATAGIIATVAAVGLMILSCVLCGRWRKARRLGRQQVEVLQQSKTLNQHAQNPLLPIAAPPAH